MGLGFGQAVHQRGCVAAFAIGDDLGQFGLGGAESYPGVFGVFAGFADDAVIADFVAQGGTLIVSALTATRELPSAQDALLLPGATA
mgnify:CR=1 FL=1